MPLKRLPMVMATSQSYTHGCVQASGVSQSGRPPWDETRVPRGDLGRMRGTDAGLEAPARRVGTALAERRTALLACLVAGELVAAALYGSHGAGAVDGGGHAFSSHARYATDSKPITGSITKPSRVMAHRAPATTPGRTARGRGGGQVLGVGQASVGTAIDHVRPCCGYSNAPHLLEPPTRP